METSEVYLTRVSAFLPNEPVSNEEMEQFLGFIGGRRSRSRPIVLRNNRITSRHYAIDREGRSTHTNAQLTAEAVRRLYGPGFGPADLALLACGTTSPDQLLPPHASMVHGELGGAPAETVTFTGACLSGIDALKYAFLAVKCGQVRAAVAAGSEKLSNWMLARGFEEEAHLLAALEENPIIAFEKDFLRWMLSDGAGAALLAGCPAPGGTSLRVEWIDIVSYANEVGPCMWAGAERDEAGSLRGWRDCEPREWLSRSVFSFKQDVRLLDQHIAVLGARSVAEALSRHGVAPGEIDWFLPHLSSMYFSSPVAEALARAGCGFPEERWFVNLTRVGNVGAASIYLALEELLATKALAPGTRILLTVPESSRFSYANALLTVV